MLPSAEYDTQPPCKSFVERRSSPRTACHWEAVVRLEDGTSFDAVVVDASKGGMKLLCNAPVEKGHCVRVEMRDIGGYGCEVRWRVQGRFGVQFLNSPNELTCGELDAVAECIRWELRLAPQG